MKTNKSCLITIIVLLAACKASAWTMYENISTTDSFTAVDNKLAGEKFSYAPEYESGFADPSLTYETWIKDGVVVTIGFKNNRAAAVFVGKNYRDEKEESTEWLKTFDSLKALYGNPENVLGKGETKFVSDYRWMTSGNEIRLKEYYGDGGYHINESYQTKGAATSDKSDKSLSIAELWEKANAGYKKKDYDTALKYYLQALKLAPDNIVIVGNIAACYDELGKYEEAIKYYKKSLQLNPDSSDADVIRNVIKDIKKDMESQKKGNGKSAGKQKKPQKKVTYYKNTECRKSSDPESYCKDADDCLRNMFDSLDDKLGVDNKTLMDSANAAITILKKMPKDADCPYVEENLTNLEESVKDVNHLVEYRKYYHKMKKWQEKEEKGRQYEICKQNNSRKACYLQERHPDWPIDECEAIILKKIWNGMSKEQAYASWYEPQKKAYGSEDGEKIEVWYYIKSIYKHKNWKDWVGTFDHDEPYADLYFKNGILFRYVIY